MGEPENPEEYIQNLVQLGKGQDLEQTILTEEEKEVWSEYQSLAKQYLHDKHELVAIRIGGVLSLIATIASAWRAAEAYNSEDLGKAVLLGLGAIGFAVVDYLILQHAGEEKEKLRELYNRIIKVRRKEPFYTVEPLMRELLPDWKPIGKLY